MTQKLGRIESKLKSSESSFNFFQNSVIFCIFCSRGYTAKGSILYNPPARLSVAHMAQRVKVKMISTDKQ